MGLLRLRQLALPFLLFAGLQAVPMHADGNRFDLTGPKIDVRVTRGTESLDIAHVPNLKGGDKLWLHPDLPPTQSVHYLLICVFLRGTTNPPPEDWFIRIETWNKKVRAEGAFVTVPDEAQQVVLLLAPETGGDFSTLKSAVRGRPGVFVRAQQDLIEASFEQQRIEKYMASIRRVPSADSKDLQKHSDMLARTLALKPNEDCFKRQVDMQFTCLTQTGSQMLLDDGHGQTIAQRLSNGNSSDFINQVSYTGVGGAGLYSAYVGAIVDLVRLMSNIHSAQYQYIPAISFPQGSSLNLRLNTPPSFHNPKSVIVIALPAVTPSVTPPLRLSDPNQVTCLLQPNVTIPIEGAPLVFSTALSHDMVLHLNTPPGAPKEADIPLAADAYQGGLVLQGSDFASRRHELPVPAESPKIPALGTPGAPGQKPASDKPITPQPEPVILTGSIQGKWGFDTFTGPNVTLQQLPGGDWHIVPGSNLITGTTSNLLLSATGTGCVHRITAQPTGMKSPLQLEFKPDQHPDNADGSAIPLAVTLPLNESHTAGDLHLEIQQYGQPKSDTLSTRTYSAPAEITEIEMHAADRAIRLRGKNLDTISHVDVGDLVFKPKGSAQDNTLRLALPDGAPAPSTKVDDDLTASIKLNDGRVLTQPLTVTAPRPSVSIISRNIEAGGDSNITLTDKDDLPLASHLTFTLKSKASFPRNVLVEVETLDSTLHATLSLAPSGGLLLQDPHTVVATLDPSRSFGPSAFGALHARIVFPAKGNPEGKSDSDADGSVTSDWIPLVTLVRLPVLTGIQCPTDMTQNCTVSGSAFFLVDSISNDPAFANPAPVPDGYTGNTITVPHPTNGTTLFLKLRDHPVPIDSATLPVIAAPAQHHAATHKPAATPAAEKEAKPTPATPPATATATK
ncbi:hypothetical protein ACFQBQ_01345 [Granulicella cerasi]|uniref:Uncharacterized protein n=1 Tax=Granulicella cerasi TaxID=741063 RepID=A0ABW1Z531_9BACT|nr:hypothetical protein [Granulicella cerasi]